jgi:hypothetical protein
MKPIISFPSRLGFCSALSAAILTVWFAIAFGIYQPMEAVLWYAVLTGILCLVVTIIVLKDKKMFFKKLPNEK